MDTLCTAACRNYEKTCNGGKARDDVVWPTPGDGVREREFMRIHMINYASLVSAKLPKSHSPVTFYNIYKFIH